MRLDIHPRHINLYQADVAEIRALLQRGVPVNHVSRQYHVSSNTINNIGWGRYGDPPIWTLDEHGRRVLA